MLPGAPERIGKISDREEKHIRETTVQHAKNTLEAFFENGPGTREDRQRIVLNKLLEMGASNTALRMSKLS
jgi:hypothetical protein